MTAPSFPDFAVSGSGASNWTPDDEQVVANALKPIIDYFKRTKDEPEDELKAMMKRLIQVSGVTRPATPTTAGGDGGPGASTSSRSKSKDKKKKSSEDRDKHVRFIGECCLCGLEKRGNYDRLGFLCAGCRVVPIHQIQTSNATRVPRVRYSPHYVPCVQYPCRFEFLPDSSLPSRPASSLAGPHGDLLPPGAYMGGSGAVPPDAVGAAGPGATPLSKGGVSGAGSEGALDSMSQSGRLSNTGSGSQFQQHPVVSAATACGPAATAAATAVAVAAAAHLERPSSAKSAEAANKAAAAAAAATASSAPPPATAFSPNPSGVFNATTAAASPGSGRIRLPPGLTQMPPRYSVTKLDIQPEYRAEMLSAVEALRTLYHPSFLFNFALARDPRRDCIWIVHETAQPIELRGALVQGHRCYELLRQISVAALSGLLFLKDFNRTHNDLRPENFFIDERHRVKLRLAPFPVQDLPPPFSYEHSFFSVAGGGGGNGGGGAGKAGDRDRDLTSGSSFAGTNFGSGATGNDFDDSGGTGGQPIHTPSLSSASLLHRKSASFASKIDSYCLSRRTSRRRVEGQGSRDMFTLGVTLALIAYGDVDRLPLPNDDEVGSDPDELFLVEFIWRLLTGERSPDEALRDDYLTTVRLVDGAAVETIVLRVVAPPVPPVVQERLLALSDGPLAAEKDGKERSKRDKNDAAMSGPSPSGSASDMSSPVSAAGSKKPVKFDESAAEAEKKKKRDGEAGDEAGSPPARSASSRSGSTDAPGSGSGDADAAERKRQAKEKMMAKAKEMAEALNAASLRLRVNNWNTAAGRLVSFFNNSEMPPGEKEASAADPHLFQVVRTPTQLTFYSVRRDPRLLRARQIAGERQVASFSNALLASASMTLAHTTGGPPPTLPSLPSPHH